MKKLLISRIVTVFGFSISMNAFADVESNGDALVGILSLAPLAHAYYKEDAEGMLQYGSGAVSTQALTSLGKRTTHKSRPNGNCCSAFPSSHASAAFYSAFYIGERYSYSDAIPYFAGAAYVAYSRMHADKHDFADVAAGAGLSFVVNHYFTSSEVDDSKPRIGVYTRDNGGLSVVVDWRW